MTTNQKQYDDNEKRLFIKKIDHFKNLFLNYFDKWDDRDANQFMYWQYEGGKGFISFFYMKPIAIPKFEYYQYPNIMTLRDALIKLTSKHKDELKLKNDLPSMVELENYLKELDTKRYSHSMDFDFDFDAINHFFSTKGLLIKSEIIRLLNQAKQKVVSISIQDTTFSATTRTPKNLEGQIEQKSNFKKRLEDMDALLDSYGVTITFLFTPTKINAFEFKKQIYTAIKLLEATPFIKAVQNTHFVFGTAFALRKKGGFLERYRPMASYVSEGSSPLKNHILYAVDSEGDPKYNYYPVYATIIHELGHKFHHKFMRDSYDNQSIIQLYDQAMEPTNQCFLDNLPNIGDPFSNLRKNWYLVRGNPASDYFLTNIQKNTYIYTNSNGKKIIIDKSVLLQLITCPSEYGAKNEKEFFAEMCVLITLDEVKPSQQMIANSFLDIVVTESI